MGSFRLLQANAFQGKEIFSLFDVRKKIKKTGVPLCDMSDPCLYLKKKKNHINLKMSESFAEVIFHTLLGTYLLNKSSQHSLKKIPRTTSRQHSN